MPFHCVSSSGKKLYSFTYDATAWAELKEQSKSLSLKMSCCDTPAVLKTSRLGTQFFAHKSKASSCEHSSKGETVEHQFCKFLVSRQLYQMGWHVETEKVGYTPEGKMWIADIYAERKKAKIAIEIQWSPQDYEETVRRQQAYKSSGLDCIWFLNTRRNYDYSQSAKYKKRTRELPVFPFTKECDGAFYVHSIFSAKHLQKNYSIAYSMELVDFVSELFSGNIQFRKKETPEHSHKINLVMRNTECFNCEKELILPFELQHYAKYRDQWYHKPLTELITTSLPVPTGVLPSEHESTSIGWFYYGDKDISKTMDAVREEERRQSAEKKLKKEQSKLQINEASNDQPN